MLPELRKQTRTVVLIGLGVFVVINGCSWQPGYGGRNDRKPGIEVERFFGWPACFYCDLWRSDESMRIEPWGFALPLPIASKMYFVYSRFGILPLLLDAALVTAGVVVAAACTIAEDRGGMQRWMMVLCAAMVADTRQMSFSVRTESQCLSRTWNVPSVRQVCFGHRLVSEFPPTQSQPTTPVGLLWCWNAKRAGRPVLPTRMKRREAPWLSWRSTLWRV